MITIHEELIALSGNNPAGYISLEPLANLTLDRLKTTVSFLKGQRIPAGTKVLSTTLTSLDCFDPFDAKSPFPTHTNFPTSFDAEFSASHHPELPNPPPGKFSNPEVDILIKKSFVITLDVFITKEPRSLISKVIVEISNLRAHIRAKNNVLVMEGADFKSSMRIERLPNADALITASCIDPLEVSRVEGHLAYGVISQAIALSLAQRTEIPLSEIFPAVDFGTEIKLTILQDGKALGIIPDETVSITNQSHCSCNDGPDIDISNTNITKTIPAETKSQ